MRKFQLFIIFIILTLLLSSCSMGGTVMSQINETINSLASQLPKNDVNIANARFEQILDSLKNRDTTAMKNVFSKKAISDAANLDESITALFDFFQGEYLSHNDWGGPISDAGKNDDGTGREWKTLRSTYDVETSKEKYRFAIEEYIADTSNPDNVGVYSLYVIKTEDTDVSFAYWGDGYWTAGINIQGRV